MPDDRLDIMLAFVHIVIDRGTYLNIFCNICGTDLYTIYFYE